MIADRTLFEYLDLTTLDFLFVGLVEVRSERTKKKKVEYTTRNAHFNFGCKSKCTYISTIHCFINRYTLRFITTKR